MSSSIAKTAFDAIRAKQSAAVAGYNPIVVGNQDVYERLLRLASKGRLLTSLVNAGYVSRVLSISHMIQSFIAYHKFMASSSAQKKQKLRIVLLGCGIDVIGLWAHSLLRKDNKCNLGDDDSASLLSITIVEIDTPEICSIKRSILTDQGIVSNLVERSCSDGVWASNDATGTDTGKKTASAATPYYAGTIDLPLWCNE